MAAAVLIAAMVVFAWPLLPEEERSDIPIAVGNTLTVLSLNLQFGQADIEEVSELITSDVDVLALQEYPPGFEEALAAAGLLEEFPHHVGTADTDASGTMLLSRTPLELVARAEGTAFENLIATTTVEGTDWHLGVIHTAPPQMGADAWARDGAVVKDLAEPYLEENLLLVGDFNAIDQHHTMRELTGGGDLYDLAARGQGEGLGWHPTWPTGTWAPSFARIDHALVSSRVRGSVPQFETVAGSDHKALIVEVAARIE
ncbi:endonuclease/exonuclease/phosphatase family protein [Brachybacterium sp. AOP35-5H-19]|uniref:endonuclease/exonuclease/phosphatase family protein n=1 Tax=Brachybacterium sp. AOP35-5H-19 TaxID=3457685 RepID=UPI0040337625